VVVAFGLFGDYPEANERHFAFMLEGLAGVADSLRERGIWFVMRLGRPDAVCLALAREAALVVCDRGYLRHQKAWRETVAWEAGRQVVQVEGDVVAPVDRVSDKREYAARTIRPKIGRLVEAYLRDKGRAVPSNRRCVFESPRTWIGRILTASSGASTWTARWAGGVVSRGAPARPSAVYDSSCARGSTATAVPATIQRIPSART